MTATKAWKRERYDDDTTIYRRGDLTIYLYRTGPGRFRWELYRDCATATEEILDSGSSAISLGPYRTLRDALSDAKERADAVEQTH